MKHLIFPRLFVLEEATQEFYDLPLPYSCQKTLLIPEESPTPQPRGRNVAYKGQESWTDRFMLSRVRDKICVVSVRKETLESKWELV